jgi:hypothetical protein
MVGNRIIGAVALGALLCVAGGCGNKSSDAADAPAPAGPTTGGVDTSVSTPSADASSDSTAPATSSGSATPGALDVCSVLTPAALSHITGTTFTRAESRSTAGLIYTCNYTNASSDQLDVSVTVSGGAIGYQTDLQVLHQVGHDPNPVSGVGDKAFSQQDPKGNAGSVGVSSFASFGALFGDVYIQTSGLDYVTAAQGTQIANQLHAAM